MLHPVPFLTSSLHITDVHDQSRGAKRARQLFFPVRCDGVLVRHGCLAARLSMRLCTGVTSDTSSGTVRKGNRGWIRCRRSTKSDRAHDRAPSRSVRRERRVRVHVQARNQRSGGRDRTARRRGRVGCRVEREGLPVDALEARDTAIVPVTP